MNKDKNQKQNGITLIALIITIIIMLILVGVTISTVMDGGLFDYAGKAVSETQNAINQEQQFIDDIINEYLDNNGEFDTEEWDEDAAPADVFIWQSDDPNDEGYGVVVGYKANIDNYPTLRIPSRCTKIEIDTSYVEPTDDLTTAEIRSYTQNIKEIELPETIVEIGKEAFGNYSFSSLQKINIPGSVTIIGECAFQNCDGLTNIIIPSSVTSIGNKVFFDCDSLTSVTIPDSVTSIGSYAFSGCSGLVNITIPDSVTSIGGSAFEDCTSLTSVTIPDSVTNIGARAFWNVPHIMYNGTATGEPWGALSMN